MALRETVSRIKHRVRPKTKESEELAYWKERVADEGTLGNEHYASFYTEAFGLTAEDYADKRVIDIGCGPRGSLEWATLAKERVGLDPLADEYLKLGADRHAMTYVASGCEKIPYPDGHFDIVTSFNSLDHVDDLAASIAEITRIAKPDAMMLLIVEVEHEPTPTEPLFLPWSLLDDFDGWETIEERRADLGDDHNVYGAWQRQDPPVDGRPGLLGARLLRL